jgi:hypothetical protein
MSSQLFFNLFEVSFLGWLSAPPLLAWAWFRWIKRDWHSPTGRHKLGLLALLLTTLQLLGSVAAVFVIATMSRSPANAWQYWTGFSLACGLGAVLLSMLSDSQAVQQVIACSLVTSVECLILTTLR